MCRRFPPDDRTVLGAELRRLAYAVVAAVASAMVSTGPHRLARLETASCSLTQLEALLHVARDLDLCSMRDFAKLEAWCVETGKTVYGLRRKLAGAKAVPARQS